MKKDMYAIDELPFSGYKTATAIPSSKAKGIAVVIVLNRIFLYGIHQFPSIREVKEFGDEG